MMAIPEGSKIVTLNLFQGLKTRCRNKFRMTQIDIEQMFISIIKSISYAILKKAHKCAEIDDRETRQPVRPAPKFKGLRNALSALFFQRLGPKKGGGDYAAI